MKFTPVCVSRVQFYSRINFRQKSPDASENAYLPQSWPDISEMENHGEDTTISALVKAADLESVREQYSMRICVLTRLRQLHQWLVYAITFLYVGYMSDL